MAHAALTTLGTSQFDSTIFYIILLVINLGCLTFIFAYYKEMGQLVDYNNDLTRDGFLYIFAGVIVMLLVSTFFTLPFKTTALYVPMFSSTPLSFNLGTFTWSALYNLGLIANAEETTKLVGHNSIYMYLSSSHPGWSKKRIYGTLTYAGIVGVVSPILFWATLHAYVAYVGLIVWQLVAAAFVSGLILFYVMYKTRSLLAAILTHGLFNLVVLTAAGMGWLAIAYTVTPVMLIPFSLMSLALAAQSWRRQKKLKLK